MSSNGQKDAFSIILVGDDHETQGFAVNILSNSGYKVRVARTSEDFFRLLQGIEQSIDLIALDMAAGDLSSPALRLLKRMRQREGLADLPVIFFADAATGDLVARLLSHSVRAVLAKPLNPELLVVKVGEAICARSLNHSVVHRILERIGGQDAELLAKARLTEFAEDTWQAYRTDFSTIEIAVVLPKGIEPSKFGQMSKADVQDKVRIYMSAPTGWHRVWPPSDHPSQKPG